jgi:DNA-binding LacI/PurR family transcriptional regulator
VDHDDPRKWVGRGHEVVPGKPFGWAHLQERRAIREHLIARGHDPNGFAFPFRVVAIQDRIHKYKPTLRERQEAAPRPPRMRRDDEFTREELEHLCELLAGANHPLSVDMLDRAVRVLAKLQNEE